MPMALPSPFRARRRAREEERPTPAAFIRPESAPKQFCSNDDAAELRRVKRDRRRALSALRSREKQDWRDAP